MYRFARAVLQFLAVGVFRFQTLLAPCYPLFETLDISSCQLSPDVDVQSHERPLVVGARHENHQTHQIGQPVNEQGFRIPTVVRGSFAEQDQEQVSRKDS